MTDNMGTRYTHKNTGGVYTYIGCGIDEKTMMPVVIYRAADNVIWVRSSLQFYDSRFYLTDAP